MTETGRLRAGTALVCRVGDKRFALATDAVREVCTGLELVRMPGVAPPVEGVVNLRGTLVTVVRGDLLVPGSSAGAGAPSAWCVVLRLRGGRIGLGVDEILDLSGDDAEVVGDLEARLESMFGATR